MTSRRTFVAAATIAAAKPASAASPALALGPLQLEIDAAENAEFGRRVRAAVRDVSRNLAGKLLLDPDPGLQIDPTSGRRAIVHALIAVDGEVRALYSTYPPALVRPMSQGSVSKALGVIALAQARPDLAAPTGRWLARPVRGLREADHTIGGGSMTAFEALARSRNLPTTWALTRVGDARLRQELRAAGLAAPRDYPAAVAVAYGHIEWNPIQVACLFDAIATGTPRGVRLTSVPLVSPVIAAWAAKALRSGAGDAARRLLAAPVLHPRGTAHHLAAALAGKRPIAKTGTAVNVADEDVAKVLVAAFNTQAGVATIYAAMTSPRPDLPLGTNLPTARFAPLHLALVRYALEIGK